MVSIESSSAASRDWRKWLLFAVMGLLALRVLSIDEHFLIDPKDDEWAHIAPFQWWLLGHGVAGMLALAIGPFQFSESLRRSRPWLHRRLGWTYFGSIAVAAPLAIYIGMNWEDDHSSALEGWAQGGGWLLCAVLAVTFAVKRNIAIHRQWAARSYGFTFVFIMARAPHIVNWHWKTGADFVTYRWFLVFAALIVPDLILQSGALFKRRVVRAAARG